MLYSKNHRSFLQAFRIWPYPASLSPFSHHPPCLAVCASATLQRARFPQASVHLHLFFLLPGTTCHHHPPSPQKNIQQTWIISTSAQITPPPSPHPTPDPPQPPPAFLYILVWIRCPSYLLP